MEPKPKIPRPTVKRLSLYFRELGQLISVGRKTISSKQLGDALGLAGVQVRKDLTFFGQVGNPGVGYDVEKLHLHLKQALGRDRTWNAALVGAGNIGRALLSYDHFTIGDFHIAAVFDSNDRAIGREYGGREIQPMDRMGELVQHHEIMLGIIAVPAPAAQVVADHMIEAGITGILNFAPRRLEVGDDVSITSVDFTLALEQLAFQVSLGLSGSLDDDPS
jgi:redox-sensing transcriptional repressor